MQVLIFALLALAVSADNYGYSSYPSYSSYSSYPSSYSSGYGSGYGGGYGSSLYGTSYGSGIGYGVGGIGQSYYSGSGNLGGYASYRPSVYQTARYSYTYPYGTAEAYKAGSYGHSTSGGPAKIVYTQDFSGIEGHSGYQQGAPVIAGVEKYIVAPVHTSAHGSGAGSWNKAIGQEQTATGDFSGVQFAQEVAGIGAKDFENAALVDTGYAGTKGATVPKVPSGSFIETGAVGKSGAQGSSTTEGGRSQISFTRDLPKTTGHSGGAATKTTSPNSDKLSPQRTVAIAPKVPTGSIGGSGYVDKSGGHKTGNTVGHSQVSFVQDFSKVTGQSHQFEVKPEIQRIVPVSGGIASKRISGQNFGTAHKTGNQGIRQAGEVTFIQGQEAISRHSGHRVTGQKQFVTSFDKLTTGGVPSAKQSSGYIHRAGSVYQRGTHGFSTAAGPQISFILGGTELYQREGYRPASIDRLVPALPAVRPHSSGYIHHTGSIHKNEDHGFPAGAGPQIVFIRGGQTVQRQPAIVPKQSSGYQRVVGVVSKNTGQGFATSGPSRISFTQDFSKVSGHKAASIRPEISTFDEFGVPAFPGTIVSQGHQPGKINKATIASKSTQGSSTAVKAPKQPAFTEFDSQSPTHALYYGSAEGHNLGDKSIFIEGPAAGFADGYAVDYKHNIASVGGITGDKLSSFDVVPKTTFTDDKSSVLKFTSAADGSVHGGVQHSSAVFGVTGDAARSYKVSSEDNSGDKSNLYVAVPAEDYDDEKSSLFLHSSGVAPTGTFVEDKGSFYQLSSESSDSGVATHDRYESQVPVL